MVTQLKDFRQRKDHFMGHDQQSPLTGEQQESFQGLSYYPENPQLRLEIEVPPFAKQDQVEMQTSTGDLRTFTRYGRFVFEVEGEQAELTLFASPHGYFLPFVDANAGTETYVAGRYLDPEQLENGKFLIDFNLAYNPYCAYNEHYSCPLPPAENRLSVAIMAGEKNFA